MSTATPTTAYGATLLRVSLGVIFLAHAWLKIGVFTIPGTVQFFQSIGLPGFFAYLIIAGELFGGLALIAGVLTRWAALGLAVIGFGSIIAHSGNGWVFSAPGGGWEYPAFLGVASLAVALLGPGALALSRR